MAILTVSSIINIPDIIGVILDDIMVAEFIEFYEFAE